MLAITLSGAPGLASSALDLEPELSSSGHSYLVHVLLRPGRVRRCQMVFLPARDTESAVFIERGRPRGPATVVATEFRTAAMVQVLRFLHEEQRRDPPALDEGALQRAYGRVSWRIRTERTTLAAPTADLLEQVWEQMLARTRPRQLRLGLDGVRYHATHWYGRQGYRCGTTWSPPDGSLARDFVTLAEVLRELPRLRGQAQVAARRHLEEQAQVLLRRIAEENAKDSATPPSSQPATSRSTQCDFKPVPRPRPPPPPRPDDCPTCPTSAMKALRK
jgi:hypothetical protein